MAYKRILIDDFNNEVIDNGNWDVTQGPGAEETSGTLNMASTMDYPRVEGKHFFDLSTGIFASRLSSTGTKTEGTEFYIGAHDGAGNHISCLGAPDGSYLTFLPGGLATFNNEVITDLSVGLGAGWEDGTWWGIGNMSSDNVIRVYKSVDGQIWDEMARCTVGGVFDKNNAALIFMAGVWNGTSSDLIAKFDDASFWIDIPDSPQMAKVRSSGSWTDVSPKVKISGEWFSSTIKTMSEDIWRSPQ